MFLTQIFAALNSITISISGDCVNNGAYLLFSKIFFALFGDRNKVKIFYYLFFLGTFDKLKPASIETGSLLQDTAIFRK